jgi:hypothetical protein
VQKLLTGAERKVPLTEPSGEAGEVLDNWRRQLISEQLGIIDQQPPGAVALVSFDFSTATQGEMLPLAEAMLGRLRGQGLRVILVSLEPEGATLAQQLLEERKDVYGADVVNLGYLPGQVAAIRELATGRLALDTMPDFKERLTLAQRQTDWPVHNFSQVAGVVTLADNPATARWWIEQMALAAPPDQSQRFLLAATSAAAEPFLRPYRESQQPIAGAPGQYKPQLDGLISGINGAAAIESGRKQFGPARQMLDSQSVAHLLIIFLIAAGTIAGWMPRPPANESENQPEESTSP